VAPSLKNIPGIGSIIGLVRPLALRVIIASAVLPACSPGSASVDGDAADSAVDGLIVDTGDGGAIEAVPGIGEWASEGEDGVRKGDSSVLKEASGIAFHQAEGKYYVASDKGYIHRTDSEGNDEVKWTIGGDPEGVTIDEVTDDAIATIFVADEAINGVRIFVIEGDELIEIGSCVLDLDVDEEEGDGFEGIAFVSFEEAPDNWGDYPRGFIVAGSQATAKLSVYSVADCMGGGNITALDIEGVDNEGALVTSKDDVSGLTYNAEIGKILAVHDKGNLLDVMRLDGVLEHTFELPGGHHEGVVLRGIDCAGGVGILAIPDDEKGGYVEYPDFPAYCVDGVQGRANAR
jgi:hypothetical protein